MSKISVLLIERNVTYDEIRNTFLSSPTLPLLYQYWYRESFCYFSPKAC